MLERFYYMFFIRVFNSYNKPINQIALKAYFNVSYFQMLNVITLWLILDYFNLVFIPKYNLKRYAILFGLIILIVNYLFLYRKRKEIITQINALPEKKIKTEKIIFVIYVFTSIVLFPTAVAYRN
jgi:hypothetical protein